MAYLKEFFSQPGSVTHQLKSTALLCGLDGQTVYGISKGKKMLFDPVFIEVFSDKNLNIYYIQKKETFDISKLFIAIYSTLQKLT